MPDPDEPPEVLPPEDPLPEEEEPPVPEEDEPEFPEPGEPDSPYGDPEPEFEPPMGCSALGRSDPPAAFR